MLSAVAQCLKHTHKTDFHATVFRIMVNFKWAMDVAQTLCHKILFDINNDFDSLQLIEILRYINWHKCDCLYRMCKMNLSIASCESR